MKLKVILPIITLALAGGSIASAQGLREQAPVTVTVSSPANGVTVGRTITFTGTARPDIGLSVLIDGNVYIPVQDRGESEGRGLSNAGNADANGRFSFTIDLSGQAIKEAEGAAVRAVPAGRHTFVVTELYAPDAGQSQPIVLNVTDGTVDQAEAEAPSVATPTPTATPSPTASPLAADTTGRPDWVMLVLAGAIGGISAYGFHRLYYRNRKK